MNRSVVVATAAVYAAMYVALVAFFPFLSFLQLNVRIANVLKGMVKFWPAGVLLGNFAAVVVGNYLFSPLGFLDVLLSPVVSTALLGLAYVMSRRSFFAGLTANAVLLGTYLAWLISVVPPGADFFALLPLLLAGVLMSDLVLPYVLYRAMVNLKLSRGVLGRS